MVIAYVFWSLIYATVGYFLFQAVHSPKEMLYEIINGHYHMWFLLMIIGLYMIIPFLNRIVSDRKTAIYFVVLSFAFAFFLPQLIKIIRLKYVGLADLLSTVISNMKLRMVLGFSGYFVLGYLLNTCEIKKKWENTIYVFGVLALLLSIGATAFVSLRRQTATAIFYENTTVNTLLAAVAVFVFAKSHLNKPVMSEKKQGVLTFVSKCTFGVYLIHPLLLEVAVKCFRITPVSLNPLVSVPAFSLAIFLVSLLLSSLLNKIPIVKTWLV